MSITRLVKWGNSIGVRIPAHDLRVANAYVGEKFELMVDTTGNFVLSPIKDLHERWLKAFNKAAEAEEDALIIDEVSNEFDQDEWKW